MVQRRRRPETGEAPCGSREYRLSSHRLVSATFECTPRTIRSAIHRLGHVCMGASELKRRTRASVDVNDTTDFCAIRFSHQSHRRPLHQPFEPCQRCKDPILGVRSHLGGRQFCRPNHTNPHVVCCGAAPAISARKHRLLRAHSRGGVVKVQSLAVGAPRPPGMFRASQAISTSGFVGVTWRNPLAPRAAYSRGEQPASQGSAGDFACVSAAARDAAALDGFRLKRRRCTLNTR